MHIDSSKLKYPPDLRGRAEAPVRGNAPNPETVSPDNRENQLVFVVLLLTGLIFLADILVPQNYALWVFYDIPLLLTSRSKRNRLLYLTASFISMATMGGMFFGREGMSVSIAVVNRMTSVISIWIIAFLLQKYRFSKRILWMSDELRKEKDELEEQVWRRTVDLEKTIERLRGEMSGRERAQSAIAENEKLLRTVLDTLPVGMFILDRNGVIVQSNPAARQIWGGERRVGPKEYDEYKGWRADTGNRIAPEDWAAVRALRSGEITLGEEICIETFDGTPKTILNSVVPLRNEHDEITGAIVINEDVTQQIQVNNELGKYREQLEELVRERTIRLEKEIEERKRIETDLRESEERFRALVESTSDWIWEVDRHLAYVYSSPQVKTLLGYAPEEVIGKKPFDFMPPEEAERLAREYGSRIERHIPLAVIENINIHKNGTEIVLETSGVPVFDNKGVFRGYRGIDRDITKRKQVEAALRESEERFRLALENSATTVFSQDKELRYTWMFNPLVGNVESYIGKNESGVMNPDDAEFFFRIKKKVMEAGEDERGEYALPVDGSFRNFSYIIKPHRDPRGEIIGVITAATDVTLIRQAEEQARQLAERLRRQTVQLEAANRELESFSYSVSHDLRAPLRTLDGFSQALLEDYSGRLDADGRNYLARIRAAAQHMARLIDDLLQLSRTTRAEIHFTTVNLTSRAHSIFEELRQADPGRNVETLVQEGIYVEGDEVLLHQVLQNLLGNAWKFTARQETARIEFGEKCENGRRIFFVRDNGAGFDMSHAGDLFLPFRRLHADAEYPGTGIGLSIVKRIIERHDGSVWAESEPGKGATFYFTIGA